MNPLAANPEPQHTYDEHWMQCALQQAHLADDKEEVPVGACLVHNQAVIGHGFNQNIEKHDPSAHAEIQALRQACLAQKDHRLPEKTTLYVTLEPCIMCLGALVHARVHRIVFGLFNQTGCLTKSPLPDANHQVQWTPEVLKAPCQTLLNEFFARKRPHSA